MIVGYTAGVYDLFHIGHLNLFRNAKIHCDKLIVGVSTDDLVFSYKGKRPVIPFEERFEIIKSIRYVDEVYIQDDLDKISAWLQLRYNVIFVGDDWKGSDRWSKYETDLQGIAQLIYLPYTNHTSSTLLRQVLTKIADN